MDNSHLLANNDDEEPDLSLFQAWQGKHNKGLWGEEGHEEQKQRLDQELQDRVHENEGQEEAAQFLWYRPPHIGN